MELFFNNMVTFLIVAFAVFLIVRAVNRLKPQEAKAAAQYQGLPVLPDADSDRRHPLP